MATTYRPGYITNYDIEIPQGGDFSMPIGVIAQAQGGSEYLVDTAGFTAFLTIRDEDYDGDIVLEANTTNGRIQVGFTPPSWEASTAYGLGQEIVPTELNGFVYECTVAGTSDGSEPTWPTTLTQTVADNTATWRCELVETVANGLVSNCYVQVLAAVTELLTDWGKGTYVLQVFDTYGYCVYWQDGIARLRQTTN